MTLITRYGASKVRTSHTPLPSSCPTFTTYPSTPTHAPTPSPSTYRVSRITSFSGSLIHPRSTLLLLPQLFVLGREPPFCSPFLFYLPSLPYFPFLDSFLIPTHFCTTWNGYALCLLGLWRNVLNSIAHYSISFPSSRGSISFPHPSVFPVFPVGCGVDVLCIYDGGGGSERKCSSVGWFRVKAVLGCSGVPEAKRGSSSSRMRSDRLFFPFPFFWEFGSMHVWEDLDVLVIYFPCSLPPPPFSRSPSCFFFFRTYGRLPLSFRCFHLCHPSLLSLPCSRFHFCLSLSLHFLSSSI